MDNFVLRNQVLNVFIQKHVYQFRIYKYQMSNNQGSSKNVDKNSLENSSYVQQNDQSYDSIGYETRIDSSSRNTCKFILLIGFLLAAFLGLGAFLYRYDQSLRERERQLTRLANQSIKGIAENSRSRQELDLKKMEVERQIDLSKQYITRVNKENEDLQRKKIQISKIQKDISLLENKQIQERKKQVEKLMALSKEQAEKISNHLKDLDEKGKQVLRLKNIQKQSLDTNSKIKKELEDKNKEIAKLTAQLKEQSEKSIKSLEEKQKEITRLKKVQSDNLEIISKLTQSKQHLASVDAIEKQINLLKTNCKQSQTLQEKQKQLEKLKQQQKKIAKEHQAKIELLANQKKQKDQQIFQLKNSAISSINKIAQLKQQIIPKNYISVSEFDKFFYLLGLKVDGSAENKNLRDDMEKLLAYRMGNFIENKAVEKIEEIKPSKPEELTKFEKELGLDSEDYHEKLAIKLLENSLAEKRDDRISEIEQVKAEKKYSLSKVAKELPICIVVEDDNRVAQQNIKVLESLNRQMYSNFHVVWVQEVEKVQEEQKWPEGRAKNRMKMVHNEKQYGTTANLYFLASKFCNKDGIVLLMDKGVTLLGRQSLRILNSVYQPPDIMFTRSPLLLKRDEYDLVSSQIRELEEQLSKVDRKYSVKDGLIRSFRREMLDLVPIESLMRTKYDPKANISSLLFETDSNVFPVYARLEQLAKGKGANVPDYLQAALRVQGNCQKAHQEYIDSRRKLNPKVSAKEWQNFVNLERALGKCLSKYTQKIDHHLKHPIRVVTDGRYYKQTIYNEYAVNVSLGKNPKYQIKLKQFLPKVTNIWRSFKAQEVRSEKDQYYVMIPQDYEPIVKSNRVDFESFKTGIENEIAFEILEFKPDPTINMIPPQLNLTAFKDENEAIFFLKQKLKDINVDVPDKTDYLYHLAYRMQLYPQEKQTIDLEYHLINQIYKIEKQKLEDDIRFCLVTPGYKIRNRKNGTGDGYLYETYFRFLQIMNYTNYHVVYIDDASPDNSTEFIYDYVAKSSMKIKNRMKIVHILKNVGVAVNTIFMPQKMCGQNEVVVLVDADDNLLGRQSLRIFNAMYKNPNIWYAWTRHLLWNGKRWAWRGATLLDRSAYVRVTDRWVVANTKTFRSNLMRGVPFFHMVEYHYSKDNYTAWPVFQDLSADGLQVSLNVELAGRPHLDYYHGITHGYSGAAGAGCYPRLEKYDWRKTMCRSRLQPLKKLDGFEKGVLTEGEPFQQQYFQDAIDLSNYLLEKKCFWK